MSSSCSCVVYLTRLPIVTRVIVTHARSHATSTISVSTELILYTQNAPNIEKLNWSYPALDGYKREGMEGSEDGREGKGKRVRKGRGKNGQ